MREWQTPVAILLTLLLSVPATLVGVLMGWFYRVMIGWAFQTNWLNSLTDDWFGRVGTEIIPGLISGGVAGALAIAVSFFALRRANYEIVGYAAATGLILISGLGLAYGIRKLGLQAADAQRIASLIGITLGLVLTGRELKR